MRKLLQVLVTFVGALIAIWLANEFNIFNYMTFVPNNKSFDVCITVYFTVVESIVNVSYTMIINWLDKQKVEIETILFTSNDEPNKNTCPIVRFNTMGIAEMNMKVSVKGNRSRVKDKTIILNSMIQVEYQVGRRGSGAKVDNEGNYIIEIEKLCSNQEIVNIEETYKIVLQRGALDDSAQIIVTPKLNDNNSKLIVFESNNAKLALEER